MAESYKLSLILLFLYLTSDASSTIARTHQLPPTTENHKNNSQLQTYIVHVQQSSATASFSTDDEREKWYKSFFPINVATEGGSSKLIYSYKNVATAFAARLTPDELIEMEKKTGFVTAYPDRLASVATTRTPEFLGLHRHATGFWNKSNFGKGVIIGMLDTGISPGHPSFQDRERIMPPPPAKWKGFCEFNASDCNNKLIGVRNFAQGLNSMQEAPTKPAAPYDISGHGTHTASTAAGMFVDNASVNGLANGTASGIAPYAHLAIYKVCDILSCANSDILAGIDAAVNDGVDVLSLSIVSTSYSFYNDPIAIGTFAAMEKGIFISCAAGNSGPRLSTLSNEAPWILTVGASTVDRSIRSTVKVGSGKEFNGESLYQPKNYTSPKVPLVYFGESFSASGCLNGSLDNSLVEGKIVVCNAWGADNGTVVKIAGGSGMIIAATDDGYLPDQVHVLPTSYVSYSDGLEIKAYIAATPKPTASLSFKGTIIGTSPAPLVASFSSRGPNFADPNILKPDIIGPGVNILAAWPFQIGDSQVLSTSSTFNIISGTSMATPHLSGIAALLKSSHPDWSPAAIKSAIMTTADLTSNDGNQIPDQNMEPTNYFALGSGHVNVSKANNPGFIYDVTRDDYIRYLCGLGYTNSQVSTIAGQRIECSNISSVVWSDLNYPSFMVILNATNDYTMAVNRTVTNVGAPNSVYTVKVKSPVGASVTVEPKELHFSQANEKAQYFVNFTGTVSIRGIVSYSEGRLTWFSANDSITVNSPVMVAVG